MTRGGRLPAPAPPSLRHLTPQDADLDHDDRLVFWTPDRAATQLLSPASCNVVDLRFGAGLVHPAADIVLIDCEEAASALPPERHRAVIPPVVSTAAAPRDALRALHVLIGASPAPETLELAAQSVAWARDRGLACGVCAEPSAAGLAAAARLGPAVGLADAILDLRAPPDLYASAPALLPALAAGAPVLFRYPASLHMALRRAGCALAVADIPAGLDAFAALSSTAFQPLSAAALAYARTHHDEAAAAEALRIALQSASARHRARLDRWPAATSGMHVLVVSDEALNLIELRVHRPLAALRSRGAIAGYSLLRHGNFVSSTVPVTEDLRFHAVWVQRSMDPLVELFLQSLDRPFVYDLDDLLVVSPAYRTAFPTQSPQTVRSLATRARAVAAATPRLARSLQARGVADVLLKTVVCPNLAAGPARSVAGAVTTVVWPSSDTHALTVSGREIARAVRDFCRVHGMTLLCLGAEPPALVRDAGFAVEHCGLLTYGAYVDRLREAAPGILIGPLETGADADTQAFIDAKSDIKLIEARTAGLVGVFSRAAPYLDSDLDPAILCENTYESWLAGLERARTACLTAPPAQAWPPSRAADQIGPLPWAECLRRARTEFTAADVNAALAFVRAQGESLLTAPERFDEADYLRRHDDVRQAVRAGAMPSGYRHYVQSGHREGREVRRLPSPDDAGRLWWSRLLHCVDRLEQDAAARIGAIASLRTRRAIAAPPARPAAPPQGQAVWDGGEALALPCPACAATGPHGTAVTFMRRSMLRCAHCRTLFDPNRTPHDYTDPAAQALLLQFTLEQNAGIHAQIEPLFALDGVRSLLDVGCGFGFTVDLARTLLDWRAVGVDPSFYAAAGRAALGADLRQAYLTEASELGAPFDLVLASEVIEHVPDPLAFLVLLRRHLACAGAIALTTPDADAANPDALPAVLLATLAPGVHLTLFTRESLALALQRAGFRHVQVTAAEASLRAYASDRPLAWQADAARRREQAYRDYLSSLLDRAPSGSALWNGAAGRSLSVATRDAAGPLVDRIGAVWRERFGIDLGLPALPSCPTDPHAIGRTQPFNLAPVLLICAERADAPAHALALAQAAHRCALAVGRALQDANIVDHELRRTAVRARLHALDQLAALAPDMEAELMQILRDPSPAGLAEWADPPDDLRLARIALAFARAVGDGRLDAAMRLEPVVADPDRLCRELAEHPQPKLRALFALGVLRLNRDQDPAAALDLFRRLHVEARRHGERELAELAFAHMALAETYSGKPGTEMADATGGPGP